MTKFKRPEPLGDEEFRSLVAGLQPIIRSAFEDTRLDGGIGIHEAQAIDSYAMDDERAAARALDTYSRWQDLDLEALDPNLTCLTFTNPAGWVFHIPAYLIMVLQQMLQDEGSSWQLVDALDGSDNFKSELHAQLLPSHRRCCGRFLMLAAEGELLQDGDPHDAIQCLTESWWANLSESERASFAKRWSLEIEGPRSS